MVLIITLCILIIRSSIQIAPCKLVCEGAACARTSTDPRLIRVPECVIISIIFALLKGESEATITSDKLRSRMLYAPLYLNGKRRI